MYISIADEKRTLFTIVFHKRTPKIVHISNSNLLKLLHVLFAIVFAIFLAPILIFESVFWSKIDSQVTQTQSKQIFKQDCVVKTVWYLYCEEKRVAGMLNFQIKAEAKLRKLLPSPQHHWMILYYLEFPRKKTRFRLE